MDIVRPSLCILIYFVCTQSVLSKNGDFFNINVDQSTIKINTNIPNKTYTMAGIKLDNPERYNITGCTSSLNGYCIFSVSQTNPASVTLSGSSGPVNANLCLNAPGQISCQSYEFTLNQIPTTPYTIYVGTKYGFIDYSNNNGATWRYTKQPGGNLNYGMFIDPNGTIYLGGANGNVEYSIDNGTIWKATPQQPDGSQVISVFKSHPYIYAGTKQGNIAYSADEGHSWSYLTPPTPGSSVYSVYVVPGTPNTIYTVTVSSSYVSYVKKSLDGGTTWMDITPNNSFNYGIIFTSVFIENNIVYVGTNVTDGSSNSSNIYTSVDAGNTWTANVDFPNGINVNQLYVTPGIQSTIFAADGAGVAISINDGVNWDFSTYTIPDSSTTFSNYVYNNTLYAGTFYGNLYYTPLTNPATWSATSRQPGGNINYGFSISDNGQTWFVGGSNGTIQKSIDLGENWSYTVLGNPQIRSTFAINGHVYASDYFGNFYYSPDDGETWSSINQPNGSLILSIFATYSSLYVGNSLGELYVSNNNGGSWNLLTSPHNNSPINSLYGIDGSTMLYAGTEDGYVEISSDGGSTWNIATPPDGSAVNGISVYSNKLFAGTQNGNVTISNDEGETWINTYQSPDGYPVLSLVVK